MLTQTQYRTLLGRMKDLGIYKQHDYYTSPEWSMVREAKYQSSEYVCKCGKRTDLQLHHLTYKNFGRELGHLEDLAWRCDRCHDNEHKRPSFWWLYVIVVFGILATWFM